VVQSLVQETNQNKLIFNVKNQVVNHLVKKALWEVEKKGGGGDGKGFRKWEKEFSVKVWYSKKNKKFSRVWYSNIFNKIIANPHRPTLFWPSGLLALHSRVNPARPRAYSCRC